MGGFCGLPLRALQQCGGPPSVWGCPLLPHISRAVQSQNILQQRKCSVSAPSNRLPSTVMLPVSQKRALFFNSDHHIGEHCSRAQPETSWLTRRATSVRKAVRGTRHSSAHTPKALRSASWSCLLGRKLGLRQTNGSPRTTGLHLGEAKLGPGCS